MSAPDRAITQLLQRAAVDTLQQQAERLEHTTGALRAIGALAGALGAARQPGDATVPPEDLAHLAFALAHGLQAALQQIDEAVHAIEQAGR